MSVKRDPRNGRWRYRKWVTLPDGGRHRISGTPAVNNKRAAEDAERAHIVRVLRTGSVHPPRQQPRKELPTYAVWADQFLLIAAATNKESERQSKESALRVHLKPFFGNMNVDKIGYAEIQDYVAEKVAKRKASGDRVWSNKTINNQLTILRRSLAVARKRGMIQVIPEVEWLPTGDSDFDFLDFEEAERLLRSADEEWRCMFLVAMRTGMRLGELRALRWGDVDLVRSQVRVQRSISRGVESSPKTYRSRVVPLSPETVKALKSHRHLRGELVFCHFDGRRITRNEGKAPIKRACKRAGLRRIGWHVFRHTFASHLVMRAVPIKAVQELGGWRTIQVVMRYAHLSPEFRRGMVELLDEKPPEVFGQTPGGQRLDNERDSALK